MLDFDPRDFDSRDRDDRRPDLSRGGHSDPAARERRADRRATRATLPSATWISRVVPAGNRSASGTATTTSTATRAASWRPSARSEWCPRATSKPASAEPGIHALQTSAISARADSFRRYRYQVTGTAS